MNAKNEKILTETVVHVERIYAGDTENIMFFAGSNGSEDEPFTFKMTPTAARKVFESLANYFSTAEQGNVLSSNHTRGVPENTTT